MERESYLLLVAISVTVAALAWLIWLRTRSPAFAIGIGLVYYWSVYGAWQLIGALARGGTTGRYQYLFAKMFGVGLDGDYEKALLYYGLFLVAIAAAVLATVGRAGPPGAEARVIEVSHGRLLFMGFFSLAAAIWFIRGQLQEALAFGALGYSVTAGGTEVSPLFTLHQTFNVLTVIPIAIGVPVLFADQNARLLRARTGPGVRLAYLVFVPAQFIYGMAMGNKAELFFASIAGIVIYTANTRRLRWARLALLGAALIAVLGIIDYARSLAVADLAEGLSSGRVAASVTDIARSNEAYAAHFSMYGVLHYKVPLTWGTSVASLAASAVPRLLWADRPGTVYEHYARYLGMAEGQGYTLHHATGWYLNFGVVGVVLGGLVLGGLWGLLFRGSRPADPGRAGARAVGCAIAFAFFTGGIPSLVRVGLEGYKSVVIFSILAPLVILQAARVRGSGA